MKIYKLFAYQWINEHLVAESNNQEELVVIALEQSATTNYTYRIETWESNEMIGGWRFFNNGNEFTEQLRQSIGKHV